MMTWSGQLIYLNWSIMQVSRFYCCIVSVGLHVFDMDFLIVLAHTVFQRYAL